jgi:hypothetical protein
MASRAGSEQMYRTVWLWLLVNFVGIHCVQSGHHHTVRKALTALLRTAIDSLSDALGVGGAAQQQLTGGTITR